MKVRTLLWQDLAVDQEAAVLAAEAVEAASVAEVAVEALAEVASAAGREDLADPTMADRFSAVAGIAVPITAAVVLAVLSA